jgi:hypothetical protein
MNDLSVRRRKTPPERVVAAASDALISMPVVGRANVARVSARHRRDSVTGFQNYMKEPAVMVRLWTAEPTHFLDTVNLRTA